MNDIDPSALRVHLDLVTRIALVVKIARLAQGSVALQLERRRRKDRIEVQTVQHRGIRLASALEHMPDHRPVRRVLGHDKRSGVKIERPAFVDVQYRHREVALDVGLQVIVYAHMDLVTGVRLVVQNRGRAQRSVQIHREGRMTAVQIIVQAPVGIRIRRAEHAHDRTNGLVLSHHERAVGIQVVGRYVRHALSDIRDGDLKVLARLGTPVGDLHRDFVYVVGVDISRILIIRIRIKAQDTSRGIHGKLGLIIATRDGKGHGITIRIGGG